MLTRGKTRRPVSPAKQVAGFIAKFDPAIAKVVRSARATLRKRWPTAVELVYDNYNALAIAFGTTERQSEIIASVAVYASGANLYFMYGASLPDPAHLLQGSGNKGRFIRLVNAAVLDAPVVQGFLRAAEQRAKPPLPATGRGYTVIKLIAPKQRPRRKI